MGLLHIADRAPGAGLVFIVAAIYPTFAFGDDPRRWVSGDAAVREPRATTNRHRGEPWRYLESEVSPVRRANSRR